MFELVKEYFVTLFVFLGIDMVWLLFIAKNLYQKEIGHLMRADIGWIPAILFYLIFVVGLLYFVLRPSLESGSILKTILSGALFGLICYATYDLTNYSTLDGWSLKVTVIDIIWGATLGGVVSFISYMIFK